MTLRYETREPLCADLLERVPLKGKRAPATVRQIIEAIESLGFQIVTPTEPTFGKIVLTETLAADALDALVNAAIDMEAQAAQRTPAMQTAMLRRAAGMRDLAATLTVRPKVTA